LGDYTYDSWKKDMVTDCILVMRCLQCGSFLTVNDNFYFPDRDTYICERCNIAFTQVIPGEIVITHKLVWDEKEQKFIKTV
jgi:Zn finger protein HypA/HybF involved in hydrogenase expression